MRGYERAIMLQSLDTHWREHLAALDHLRQGIHLRGYAQKNPKQEYKREAFELFSLHAGDDQDEVTKILMTVQFRSAGGAAAGRGARSADATCSTSIADFAGALAEARRGRDAGGRRRRRAGDGRSRSCAPAQKVGRNDPCPCGSGKKYKHCHGKLDLRPTVCDRQRRSR